MRVLLVGSLPRLWAPNNLPWLRYTQSALRRLGHDVTTRTYRESWAASPALRSRASHLPGGEAALSGFAAAAAEQRDRLVVDAARTLAPELTIVLKGEVFPDHVFAEVKQFAAGPMVTWWVDDPWVHPNSVRQFALFDRVFLFDRSYMSELAAAGVDRTSFLPCACDETVYRPLSLTARDRRRLASDVAFVAAYYPQRAALVRALARRMNVGLWGTGWDTPAARADLGGFSVLRGGVVDDRTAARIYNAASIGLNVHHTQSRLGGLNTRTFELLASGTLPLVDRVAGMEELLEPGREVATYRDADEAADVASGYLADPERRQTVVKRGRARVLAEHTYVARMRTIDQVMFGSRSAAVGA